MRRLLVPTAAAAAVLVLLGGLWWFAGPGSRGNHTTFAGGDTGTADTRTGGAGSGDGDAGTPGPLGSGEPGSSGTAPPGGEVPPTDPTVDGPTEPTAVRVDSYHLNHDRRQVTLSYTIGVPECYGEIDLPKVVETSQSVTVTLNRVPPKQDADVACIEIALLKTVDIWLAEPLGDRIVLDGSVKGAVVQPGPPPGH